MSLFNVQGPERRDFNGIHNPFENPTVPLTALGLDNVYGMLQRSESGESVTVDTTMTIPTYWRCVALMSTVVAGMPLRTYKTDGRKEVFPDILSVGNAQMRHTQYELWALIVAHMMTWGNAFVLKYRDPTVGRNANMPKMMHQITDLRPIDPSRVQVKIDKESREKIFEIQQVDENGNIMVDRRPLILTTYEIMHIHGLSMDGMIGLSPVQQFVRTLGTSIAADKLAGRFYSKGTMLSGIINVRVPLPDQETADGIRNRWIQKSGGVAHGGDVAVLDAETSFQPLTIPPDSLQFLESRRWQTTEIARMHGIPPHLVGDVEKSTSWGTGIEEQNTGFINYTVSDYTNRIEQRVSREVITMTTQFCEFDMNHLLRGNMSERFEAYSVAINAGWQTRNAVRKLENEEPLPGLDDPLVPLNMQTVKQANQAAETAQKVAMRPPAPPPTQDQNNPNGNSDSNSDDEDQ